MTYTKFHLVSGCCIWGLYQMIPCLHLPQLPLRQALWRLLVAMNVCKFFSISCWLQWLCLQSASCKKGPCLAVLLVELWFWAALSACFYFFCGVVVLEIYIYIYTWTCVYICMCVYMYLSLFLSVFVLNLRTTAAHDLRQYGATLGWIVLVTFFSSCVFFTFILAQDC